MDVGLLILAGGKSTRMGYPKAKLVTGGRTFVETLAARMHSERFAERILSSNDQMEIESFLTLPDEYQGMGPMGGLLTALHHCQSKCLMVVPCDCPRLSYEIFLKLWNMHRENVPIIAETTYGLQPLIGIYPKSICGDFAYSISRGDLRMYDFLNHIAYDTQRIPDEKAFNINTAEDYHIFLNGSSEDLI